MNTENKASIIIHTRTKKAGFRTGLLAMPDDFSDKEQQFVVKQTRLLTSSIEELRGEHLIRTFSFQTDNHIIIGVAGFLCDITGTDKWLDEANRQVYGVIGFVWKSPSSILGLPNKDMYCNILEEKVYPHWEDSKNSNWASLCDKVAYEYNVNYEKLVDGIETIELPKGTDNVLWLIGNIQNSSFLNALVKNFSNGYSYCTNVTYEDEALALNFDYCTIINGAADWKFISTHPQTEENRNNASHRNENRDNSTKKGNSSIKKQPSSNGDNVAKLGIAALGVLAIGAVSFAIGKKIKNKRRGNR